MCAMMTFVDGNSSFGISFAGGWASHSLLSTTPYDGVVSFPIGSLPEMFKLKKYFCKQLINIISLKERCN